MVPYGPSCKLVARLCCTRVISRMAAWPVSHAATEDSMGLVIIVGLIWLVVAPLTADAAARRRMSRWGGLLLGLLLGPLGLAIVLLMPKRA
jgi:hypothetical protein